jgi:hypothetical protein
MATTPEERHIAGEAGFEKNHDAISAATEEPIDDTSTDENTPAYLEGWDLWYLGAALMSSAFVLSLDNTILGTYVRFFSTAMPFSHTFQQRQYLASPVSSTASTISAGMAPPTRSLKWPCFLPAVESSLSTTLSGHTLCCFSSSNWALSSAL